ncbi:SU10 major capsid protein [Micromonospora carbonacea]|uniref:SU10 major capsid protein n=1 Tax=Micromonospora carbonacea TaxID=47853 RepID=UPI00372201C8
MAGITALGTTYNLPNYTGFLHQLTPTDTPFFSAIGGLTGGGQTTDTEFEWGTYDLRSAAQNVALEGQDAPTPQERVRATAKNVTQIHHEAVAVSYTKQAATGRLSGLATAGATSSVQTELDWQTEVMLKQMVRDIEWSFINGVYQLPVDNTTARKTRGLLSAITSNVVNVGVAAQTGTAAAATDLITLTAHGLTDGDTVRFSSVGAATPLSTATVYYVVSSSANTFKVATIKGGTPVDITADGTVIWNEGSALTKEMLDGLLQTAYDNGGLMESETRTLIVGSAQKLAVTKAYTSAGYVIKNVEGNVGGVVVDRIDSDFGTLNIMLDRHMPADTIAAVSLEDCRPVYLEVPGKGHFFEEPLAKVGASDRNQLYGEVGLDYGNQMKHAKMTGLKA